LLTYHLWDGSQGRRNVLNNSLNNSMRFFKIVNIKV
jgi:hypothetical protein